MLWTDLFDSNSTKVIDKDRPGYCALLPGLDDFFTINP